MAIETSNFHGNNEIISVINTALNQMLEDFGLKDQGWQVLRSNQPTIQAIKNNTVYFDIISKRRLGVQGTKSIKDDETGQWREASVWFEEILVQVSAFKQRDPNTDTAATLTSSDIVNYLQGCVNANNDLGPDINIKNKHSYFAYDWLQVIRSTEVRELDFETDSGLKEKYPQFDFLLVVEQTLLKKIQQIANINITTERI